MRWSIDRTCLLLCAILALSSLACAGEASSSASEAEATSSSAAAASTVDDGAAQAAPARPAPPAFGDKPSTGIFENANPRSDGPGQVDLNAVLGTKPVVLYYWIPGNPRADAMFADVQELLAAHGDKVALYGMVYQRNERDVQALAQRVESLDIRVPVLKDVDFKMGRQLRVQSVPNVTIFDNEGRLRLTNGASLTQDIEYKMKLSDALTRVAKSGSLGTYGYLDRYYPVTELVGKPSPDFKAALLSTKVEQRWSTMVKDGHVNLLVFWSVDCPHCRKELPKINAWLKSKPGQVNVISAAKVDNETMRTKTKEFCDVNGIVFPTLMDREMAISNLYNITSTPTILVIRPDGVIDSVILTSGEDLGALIEEKKKALL